MKLLVDNQLPVALSRLISARDVTCQHVQDVGLEAASDEAIWSYAKLNGCVGVSKDDDFQVLANRRGAPPQIVWVRLGNCRKAALLGAFDRVFPDLIRELENASVVVEIR